MKTLFNKNLLNLISGEIMRSIKYKVLTIGSGVSLIWLIVMFFMRKNTEELKEIIPLLIFADVVLMSVILIGANIFFEKQEGSVRSLLISPVSVGQILIAKIVNSVFISMVSAAIVSIGAIIMTDIRVNLLTLFIYVIIIVSAHGAIGFALAMVSKDFNAMLVNYMLFVVVFIAPPILLMLNVIPESYELIALISPSEAGSLLINDSFHNEVEWYKILISIVYLVSLAFLIMRYFVYPRFLKDAVRG